MPDSVLIELERAELEARERRLAAVAAAEARVAAAMADAERIRAGIDREIARAIEERRREHAERAAATIAAIEAELASLEATPGPSGTDDPAVGPAVELVVAAVLGEVEA